MESKALSEQIEYECRRIAAAFGVKEWHLTEGERPFLRYEGRFYQSDNVWEWVTWELNPIDGALFSLEIGDYGGWCRVYDLLLVSEEYRALHPDKDKYWMLNYNPHFQERLARGLYRLGFEDKDVLAELDRPFSAHEQMELRLPMPRELWPQKWLDEEMEQL